MNLGGGLATVARALAKQLGKELAGSAARVALSLWRPGMKAKELAARVREFLKGLKGESRREQFGAALHRATNVARLTVQVAGLKVRPGWKITSVEVLDKVTCTSDGEGGPPRCREIDGTQYDTVAEAWADYGAGPYRFCKGGPRCRGTTRLRPAAEAPA